MTETLWTTLPTNEENKLKEVINLISNKNLTNLSINQLIEKLENNQAVDWLDVLDQYNAIPSINNSNASQMLTRAISVKNKFDRKNLKNEIIYPNLKNETFTPNQLLGLIILCYSNPSLIGPKLCKALNDNNEADIKKEMLENSSYVRSQDRVVPWTLNLRLANYALYANDTSVRLPVAVINRVKNETIQNGHTVHIVDQRGGFDEWVNGTERASRMRRDGSEIDSYAILQSLQSSELDMGGKDHLQSQLDSPVSTTEISYSGNGSELTPEVLSSNVTNNAVNSNYGNALIIGGLAVFQIARNSPVGAIVRNIGKDLATASKRVGSFFSKNNSEPEQLEQRAELLSPIAKA